MTEAHGLLDVEQGKSLNVSDTLGPVSLSGGLGAYLLLVCPEGIGAISLGLWGSLKFWFYSGLRLTEKLRLNPRQLEYLQEWSGSFFALDQLKSICVESSLFEADFIRIESSKPDGSVIFRLGDKSQAGGARSLLGRTYPAQYAEKGFE